MNWLAHLYLAEESAAFRLGSLAPDFPLARDWLGRLGPEALRGAEQHRQVDVFTDGHRIVRASIARIAPPWRRFGGILVDVFYDHFLTASWSEKSDVELKGLVAEVYESFAGFDPLLPEDIAVRLRQMREEDWLNSYGSLEGVELTLRRISRRFRKATDLAPAVGELERNYEQLRGDFDGFFRSCAGGFGARESEGAMQTNLGAGEDRFTSRRACGKN